MGRKKNLIAGGVLMLVLGLARAAGGFILLRRGGAADPSIQAPDLAVTLVGFFLVALGVILALAAIGVFRFNYQFWLIGVFSTVAFVIGGAINGYVLYGRPGDWGTIINAFVAIIILAFLLPGRSALKERRISVSD